MKNITYISAGAGSGKTTHIIGELVKALKTLRPSEIIMTTFTRAAAQEMRERAKKELLRQGFVDKANEMDAAMIGTIHSVCLTFLQKYWYLAGISPDTQQMDENDFQFYVDMSLFQLVKDEEMQQFEQWRKVLNIIHYDGKKYAPYASYWRDWLDDMVDKVRYYYIEDLEESRQKSVEEIEHTWQRIQFDQAEYNRCRDKYIEVLKTIARSQKRVEYVSTYNPIEENGDIKASYAKEEHVEAQESHAQWINAAKKAQFAEEKKNAAISIVNQLFDILKRWEEAYRLYKKEHKMLDFNDMEVEFRELLKKDEVRSELKRYKLVMVDEFQDCNPMQINIFSDISDIVAEEGGQSIWVGDPKQAIYGFRGTDTTLVKETSDRIVDGENGCKRDTLKTNYRSRGGLVQKVNELFLPIFTEKPFSLSEEDIVLQAGRSDVLDEQACLPDPWTVGRKGKSLDTSSIAYQIKQLVENKKTYVQPKGSDTKRLAQYGDIAILVRKNGTVSTLAKQMQQFGIPFFATEDKDKDSNPIENALLMELVQYKLSPAYRPHLRADILHLMKDLQTQEILADYLRAIEVGRDENGKRQYVGKYEWKKDEELIARIEDIVNGIHGKSIYELMTMLVDRLNLYDTVAKWGNKEIRQSHISRMLKLAQSYDQHCEIMELAPTFADYAAYMEDAQAKSELNLDSNSVKILTMHKSKGLEWPIVIYYDLDNDFAQDNKILEREFFGIREQRKEDKSYWLRVFPTICSGTESQLFAQQPYFSESRQRAIADEERLHYVGLTRARDILITVKEDADASTYVAEPAATSFQRIDTTKLHQDGSELTYLVSPSKNTSGKREIQTETVEAKRIPIALTEDEQPKRMRSIGSCIHAVYAAYDKTMTPDVAAAMAEGIIQSYNLSSVIKAKDVVEAIESLYAYLMAKYGQPKAVAHEVPFSLMRTNGQLLRGEIDLLWYVSEKEVVLVDYKNTKSEAPNPEHYAGQMAAYQEAIQASDLTLKGIVLFYATLGQIITLSIH